MKCLSSSLKEPLATEHSLLMTEILKHLKGHSVRDHSPVTVLTDLSGLDCSFVVEIIHLTTLIFFKFPTKNLKQQVFYGLIYHLVVFCVHSRA